MLVSSDSSPLLRSIHSRSCNWSGCWRRRMIGYWTGWFCTAAAAAAAFVTTDHPHHRSSLQHFKPISQQLQQHVPQHHYQLHTNGIGPNGGGGGGGGAVTVSSAASTASCGGGGFSSYLSHHPYHPHSVVGGTGCPTSTMVLHGHRNTARTDVQNLLTQRAFQSFIDLLHNCRDGATVRWLEQTYEFRNLEMYHGTAGLDLSKYDVWDAILFDMIQRPRDTVVVSAKRRGRGHGGWSKNNPFLEERFMEFSIDIDPPSLVARIISVRAQIAKDWVEDMKLLQQWNEKCLDDDPDDAATTTATTTTTNDAVSAADTTNCSSSSSLPPFPYASSSFRSASLDLLALLATQESIHRLLRLERQDDTYDDLRAFYVAHVAAYFDGSQTFQRFNAFLDALQDDIVTQDIMEVRAMVLDEWATSIKETNHGSLQQIILAIRMGRTFDTSPTEEQSIFTPKKKSSSSSRTAKAGTTSATAAGATEDEGLDFFQ